MSDFLSKFSGDKYEELLKAEEQKAADAPEELSVEDSSQEIPSTASESADHTPDPMTKPKPDPVTDPLPGVEFEKPEPRTDVSVSDTVTESKPTEPSQYRSPKPKRSEPIHDREPKTESSRRSAAEDTVVDPTYQQKKRRQYIIGGIIGAILLLALFFLWYQMSHVNLPNFEGKSLSEARVWGAKNKIEFMPNMVFSNDFSETIIINQTPSPNKKVKKGGEVEVNVSKGPDPEERISLPDFTHLSYDEAQAWVQQQKATGVSLILQYDDTIQRHEHIKTEFRSSDVTPDNYQRKDAVMVYYSRGEEKFEKNITVPQFVNKAKSEVDTWASSNGVKLTVKEATSSTVDQGFIISQSVSSGSKIARNDPFEITLSLGKAVIVPDYSNYSAEEAGTVPGMQPLVINRYNANVPYGNLVSQSIVPGTELTDKDDKSIKLVYSMGLPYLEDLRGTKNEGELQRYFYETYRARGANVTYSTEYVYSDEPKGLVVSQSSYSRLVPLDFHVKLGISLGGGSSVDPGDPHTPVPVIPIDPLK